MSDFSLKGSRLRDRVSHAYYNYGRLCSAHPVSCITTSILTIILLSYPFVIRLRVNANSPVDVFRSDNIFSTKMVDLEEPIPKWLTQNPSAYIQQIIVHAQFDSTKTAHFSGEKAIKDLLSHVFTVAKTLNDFPFAEGKGLKQMCFKIPKDENKATKGLPTNGCLMLLPSLFWNNNELLFYKDENVVKTIFSSQCSSSFCLRELYLGMPIRATGLKKTYSRNHHVVSLDYGITLFGSAYDNASINFVKERLSQNLNLLRVGTNDSSFLHVFYRPRKYFVSFLPLVCSYISLMFYLYFSVSKIVMVKSKWGLALAAVVTVAATSTMTAGVCIHFNLMPTLWGAELFPYLALIVGLENTLCLTRSVVYTPPRMDVRSRIAHGLSQEGYSFTKYFLLEMIFLLIGFLTFVSEIQEFCIFAWIGLVVDFYMQLFFYAPCLTFDLLRLDPEEKQRFSSMLFYSDIRQYKNYSNPRCPFVRIWPKLFEKKNKLFRVKSDPQMRDYEADGKNKRLRVHRRTTSSLNADGNSQRALMRIRLFYYWTRTRIVHRAVIVVFVSWTLWAGTGFVVKHWRSLGVPSEMEFKSNANTSFQDIGSSVRLNAEEEKETGNALSTVQLQWNTWQFQTFRWWPALFYKYNLSLSGHYITIYPTIFYRAVVQPNETNILFGKEQFSEEQTNKNAALPSLTESRLMTRIYTLETQMAIILVISAIFLVTTVGAFLIYVCFWERSQREPANARKNPSVAASDLKNFQERFSRKFAETEPVLFAGHKVSIECVAIVNANFVASSCFEGKVYVWNVATGKRVMAINRMFSNRREDFESSDHAEQGGRSDKGSLRNNSEKRSGYETHQIWCMAVRQCILFFGCADGSLEIANSEKGTVVGVYNNAVSDSGIVHLLTRGLRLVLARLDGTIELLDVTFSLDKPLVLQSINQVAAVRNHRLAISHFEATSLSLITVSQDRIIRVFDIRSAQLTYSLKGHNTAVISVCVDQMTNVLYTSCEEGVICSWDLENGQLIRTIDDVFLTNEFIELACTASMLLGYSSDGHLWIWDKTNGQLNTRITPDPTLSRKQLGRRCIIVVNNQIAATSYGDSILFWDLNYKVMAKQVCIDGPVDKLIPLNHKSVLCRVSRRLYRIDVPVMRFG